MNREDEYLFLNSDLPTKSFAFFENKRNEFCDITIQIGKNTISAHRIILSAAIPQFYEIFSDKDAQDSQEKVMSLTDIDPYALELLIDFAYTSRIKINMENVKALLPAACFLQVDAVRDACCRFLVDQLNFENVFSIREYSSLLNYSQLQKNVDSYITANFEEISETPDFLDIPFDLLIEFSRRDDLKVQSEERLFEAIMKWVKYCNSERRANLPDLLRNVRLSLVKPTYIKNYILKEEFISESIECRDLLEEVMFYHFLPEEREGLRSFPTEPRSSCETTTDETACICVMHSEVKHQVECLDLVKGKWKTNVFRNFSLDYDHTVAELNKKLYCFLPEVTYAYDVERGYFSFCKGMTFPRYCAGSVAHGTKLYVLGGCVSRACIGPQSDVVECFDPVSEEWTSLHPMKTCRRALGVVSSAEFIYVLGGVGSIPSVINTVEKFHVSTGEWTMIPPMLIKRYSLGCAALNDKIYVCGGTSDVITATAEVYDTISNEWKRIASLNTVRTLCKLVSWHGKLYALGGVKSDGKVITVEIYDPEQDQWKDGSAMNRKIPVVGASVVYLHSV